MKNGMCGIVCVGLPEVRDTERRQETKIDIVWTVRITVRRESRCFPAHERKWNGTSIRSVLRSAVSKRKADQKSNTHLLETRVRAFLGGVLLGLRFRPHYVK